MRLINVNFVAEIDPEAGDEVEDEEEAPYEYIRKQFIAKPYISDGKTEESVK